MGYYYRRRRYRSWRSRGKTPKQTKLFNKFGTPFVLEIKKAFFSLEQEAVDELFKDYGAIHGSSSASYARRSFPEWKAGQKALSGQTLERLIELVPPYLEPDQRMDLVKLLAKQYDYSGSARGIRGSVSINTEDPNPGFVELTRVLREFEVSDELARIPETVMAAATWLYDDDVTAARAVLSESKRAENRLIKESVIRELKLMRRAISSGQIKTATYSADFPAGQLYVRVYTPRKPFLQTLFAFLGKAVLALAAWAISATLFLGFIFFLVETFL